MNISAPLYFRYLAERLTKNVIACLLMITLIIILGEMAVHFPFHSKQLLFSHLLAIFFKRLELLLPLCFLIATTTTLGSMQKGGEIMAFEVSGISKNQLCLPFFTVSLIACLLIYLNHQFILPRTTPWLLQERKERALEGASSSFEVRFLDDGSRIVYTKNQEKLCDLYWIKNHGEIWHCHHLSFKSDRPIGHYVDHLQKNEHGEFQKIASYHTFALPPSFAKAKPKVENKGSLSIGTLFSLMTQRNFSLASDRGFVHSLFCYKMMSPWLSPMVVTAILPYLLPYRKRRKLTHLYLFGTLSFFLFHTLIKASIILAEHYVVSPILTIILLPLLLQSVLWFVLWKTITQRPPWFRRKKPQPLSFSPPQLFSPGSSP